MASRKLPDVRPNAARRRDIEEGEVVGERVPIDRPEWCAARDQGSKLGRDPEGVARLDIEKRFLSEPVACGEEPLSARIPKDESKHAPQPREHLGAVVFVEVD